MPDRDTPPREAPLYQRIAGILRERITDGTYPANSMLPSRRDLARTHAAAQPTIDRAIAALVAEGLLQVDSRRGTFVANGPARPRLTGMTLGVVTTMHDTDEGAENQRLWSTTITTALERSIRGSAGTTHCVNRFRRGLPLLPIGEAVAELRVAGADALALVADLGQPEESIPALRAARLPFVVVTAVDLRRPVSAVVFDNHGAGYQAAEHLLAQGYRDLRFIAPFTARWIEERIAGARDAVHDAGLPDAALAVLPGEREPDYRLIAHTRQIYEEPGYAVARQALRDGTMPGAALICVNDLTAFGVLRAAREAGATPGADFALIGMDDDPQARFAGLSTQRPPLETMGEEAGRLLLAALNGRTACTQVRILPELIPRTSTPRRGH
jgi:DNA-binding LacI/PurR family transcriptional regulator/DNA-binding transcriptional regulator YhcF (GntR family)